jgi:hypothetical protein
VKAKVLLVIACVTALVAGLLLSIDYDPMSTPRANPPEGKIGDVFRIADAGSKSDTAFDAAAPTEHVLRARFGSESSLPQNGHTASSDVSGHPGNDAGELTGGRPNRRTPAGVGSGPSSESEPKDAGDVQPSTADAPADEAERNGTGAEALGGVLDGVDAAAGAVVGNAGSSPTGPVSAAPESVDDVATAVSGAVTAADPVGGAVNGPGSIADGIGGGLP